MVECIIYCLYVLIVSEGDNMLDSYTWENRQKVLSDKQTIPDRVSKSRVKIKKQLENILEDKLLEKSIKDEWCI